MRNYTLFKRAGLPSCALVLATLVSSAFTDTPFQPTRKKPVSRLAGAVKKIELSAEHVSLDDRKQPIAFKKMGLAELGKKMGKQLTPDTKIAVLHRSVSASTLLVLLNAVEEKLNAKGYSMRTTMPKGGLRMSLKSRTDVRTLAKQGERIAALHHQVAPDKDNAAKGRLAQFASKQQLAQLGRSAHANHDKLQRWHDVGNGALIDRSRRLLTERTSDWVSPPSWNWSAGRRDFIEAHFRSRFETHAKYNPLLGSAQHTRLTAELGGYALNHELRFLEFLADFQSSHDLTAAAGSANHVQLSAKLLGQQDLFPPVNQAGPATFGPIDASKSFDTVVFDITINLLRLLGVAAEDLQGVPADLAKIFDLNVSLGVKGDVQVQVGGVLAPSEVNMASSLHIRCVGYGATGFGDLNSGPAARLRGSVTLIDDTLAVQGAARIRATSKNPELDVDFSVHDRLALGGGELDLDWALWNIFGWHPHGTVTLNWQDLTPFDGYLAGPGTIKVPLE